MGPISNARIVLGSVAIALAVVAPMLGLKTVAVAGLTFGAGAFVLPWVYVLVRVIGDVFGMLAASRVALSVGACLWLAAAVYKLGAALPSADVTRYPMQTTWMLDAAAYNSFIALPGVTFAILIGGTACLYMQTWGWPMWARYYLSFLLSQIVSVCINAPLSYLPYLTFAQTMDIIGGRLVFSVVYTILLALVGWRLAVRLHQVYGASELLPHEAWTD